MHDDKEYIKALKARGLSLLHKNRLEEAKALFLQACDLDPKDVETWIALGNVNGQLGHLDEAETCCRRALELRPDIGVIHSNLGNVYKLQGYLDKALSCYREALRLSPDSAMAHTNLGILFKMMGQIDEAKTFLQHAVRLDPTSADAYNNLGNLFFDYGQLDKALMCFREALRLKPHSAAIYNNLGNVYQMQGRLDEASVSFREALRIAPHNAIAHSNLLFMSSYRADTDMAALFAEHVRWGEIHGHRSTELIEHINIPDADRRLRLGYVSADFRNHPVGFFIEQVLAQHDKKRFEIFCYSNLAINDDLTMRLRRHADYWRDVVGQTDEAVAQLIREDRIDILVDLAGHTGGNRLLTFALKPAPVQATWMSYIATTGLRAIDYIIADRFVIPPQDERYYVEQVMRLPHRFLCFTPPRLPIEVSPLPALSGEGITFGCFNNAAKLTPPVIATWAKLLLAFPQSRLFLKSVGFGDEQTKAHYRSLFTGHGVQEERLKFAGGSPYNEYLAAYHEVDIGLDPFPYNGGTTTTESLWMGVPVITLRGDRFVSRMGDSIMMNLGLEECVAETEDAYIDKAMALAVDLQRLAELRGRLRNRLLTSPLCDGPGFTRDLEAAYRTMWEAWCRKRESTAEEHIGSGPRL
jgi:protein O-GlcNAc transferase